MSVSLLLGKLGILLGLYAFKGCYKTGLWTLRILAGCGRSVYFRLHTLELRAGEAFLRAGRAVLRRLRDGARRFRRWRRGAAHAGASFAHAVRMLAGGQTSGGLALLGRALAAAARAFFPAARTLLNYGLPLAALVLFAHVIDQPGSERYALRVSFGTRQLGFVDLGYIENEAVYDRAVGEVLQKMKGVRTGAPIDFSASFELLPVARDEPLLDRYELSDKIISSSGGDVVTAYGLYIDDGLVDVVREKGPLLDLLTIMLDRHRTGDPTETVSFIRPVAVREGLYPAGRLQSLSAVNAKINREVRGEFVYEARQGDSASLISQKFDVPQSQIIANNPGVTESLFVGDKILVSRAEPYMAVKIQRVETYEEDVPYQTETEEDASLLKGQQKVVREGAPGVDRVRAAVTYINEIETDRTELTREPVRDPVSEQISVGSKLFMQGGGGSVSANFITPVPNMRYISNYFGGHAAYRYFHGALDYAANYGTPIYASAPGVVTYSGYTPYGYGHHVIIDHGGGAQTLYSHMSSRVARLGEVVNQGQVIGYVGSTGNSTGNHCHFEIRINGAKVDPLKYLG